MKTKRSGGLQWGTWMMVLVVLVITGAVASAQMVASTSYQVNIGEAITLPVDNVTKLAIADPSIADVVPLSDKEISVIGKRVGVTTLTIVRSGGSPTVMYSVKVGNAGAEEVVRDMVRNQEVTVRAIGDALVIDGKVETEIEAQRIVQVAAAYKPQSANVVNLLEVRKPRQIKVRTRVAEINSDAIKNIGFRWLGPNGEVQYAMNYQGGGSIISGFVPPASATGTAPLSFNANAVTIDVVLQLLLTKGYARLLSEPTLVTFSGQEASFLVGQEVPIVQQLPNSFTVEFKEVGVRMKIKPTADSDNRITTVVHSEVSDVIGVGQFGIPIIGAKTADTTLQVNDGQTVVIGGLLENNIKRDFLRKVPWLADIPLFGLLFRHKEFEQAQREVLFFMTPEVLKDIDADTAAAEQTQLMRQWKLDAKKGILGGSLGLPQDKAKKIKPKVDDFDDWGLWNPDNMGFPEQKPAGPPAPSKPPTTNYEPARPATQ